MNEAKAVEPGARPWKDKATSFDWKAMVASYKSSGQAGDPGPGWGRAAGWSLEKIDKDLGYLGKPIGIASYKPYQSSGEDFLHNYLGNIGIPIELSPNFPKGADVALLTQAAAQDPKVVEEIKANLLAGKTVFITSGLLGALQGRGIEDILEVRDTGRKVALRDFLNGYGAGNGESSNDPVREHPPVLFPELAFYTNDSWGIIRGVANAKGFPILLMNRYGGGMPLRDHHAGEPGRPLQPAPGRDDRDQALPAARLPGTAGRARPASACSPTTTGPSWCSRSATTART